MRKPTKSTCGTRYVVQFIYRLEVYAVSAIFPPYNNGIDELK